MAANDNRDTRRYATMKHPVSEKEESVRYHSVVPASLRNDAGLREAHQRVQKKGKLGSPSDRASVERRTWITGYYFKPPGYPHSVHKDRDSVRDAMENHSTFVKWEDQ